MVVLRFIIVLFLGVVLFPSGSLRSAPSDSLEFAGFTQALSRIFSVEKIETILSHLPPNSKIHGYDIGDFSGDDGMDVVLSTRVDGVSGREVEVHFFLNSGPQFTHVTTIRRRYMLESIEVGFSIERGVCHVTEKTGEFDWRISGYSIVDGVFRRVTEWTTRRVRQGGQSAVLGYEQSMDYLRNLGWEHYFGANTGRSFFEQRYYVLPVYPLAAELPSDLPLYIGDTTALMVVSGGSSWYGQDDSNIRISARYDSTEVVFQLRVHDDRFLYHQAADSADYLALHFDLSAQERVRRDGSFQRYSGDKQFSIILFMGDGARQGPVAEIRGGTNYDTLRSHLHMSMRSNVEEYNTREFEIRIPLSVFLRGASLQEVGFCAVYHDVDHDLRRQWATVLSTSRSYEPGRPETYGRMRFITDHQKHHERLDLRTRFLARSLRRAGVL
jgi:hypothetical protein